MLDTSTTTGALSWSIESTYSCKSPGGLPSKAKTRRLRPNGVPFPDFRYVKGWEFHLSGSIWKGREIRLSSVCILWLWKRHENVPVLPGVFIFKRQCFYSSRNECKVLKQIRERGAIFGRQRRGTFSVKNGICNKVRGWNLGLDYTLTPATPTLTLNPPLKLKITSGLAAV